MLKKLSAFLASVFFLVWMIFFRPVFLGGPASYIIVSGVSMEPTYFTGDLVIMRKAAQYQVGDIITFDVDNKNVIHRIVGGSAAAGFITRGDNKIEDDPWQPKPQDILGKQWIHIPEVGLKLSGLRSPLGIFGVAGLAVLMLIDDLAPPAQKYKRKRNGKRMKLNLPAGSRQFSFPMPSWFAGLGGGARRRRLAAGLLPFTLVLLAVGLLSLVAAAYSFMQPLTRTVPMQDMRYEHTAVYHYTVRTLPSPIYDADTIGPIGPETDLSAGLPPIVTSLAQSIDLDLHYELAGPEHSEITGLIKPVLKLQVSEEWEQSFPFGEPISFRGSAVDARITLPLDQLREKVAAIEEQLGYTLSSYTVTVTPTILLSGTADGEPVGDEYAPPFNITFRATQALMDTELAHSEQEIVEKSVERANSLQWWKIDLPISGIRRFSALGVFVTLLPGCALALLLYFWLHNDELFQIQARYGSMIIDVTKTTLSASRAVQVASMKDLVRLAQPFGGVIFREASKGGTHVFFIPDGDILYTYLVQDGEKAS